MCIVTILNIQRDEEFVPEFKVYGRRKQNILGNIFVRHLPTKVITAHTTLILRKIKFCCLIKTVDSKCVYRELYRVLCMFFLPFELYSFIHECIYAKPLSYADKIMNIY